MKTTVKFSLILLLGLSAASCNLEKKAFKSFEVAEYQYVISLYEKVLKKDPEDAEAN